MNAEHKPLPPTEPDSMKRPLIASVLFHLFLVLVFSGAFFVFSRPVVIPPEAMSVEILPIAEKAQSDKPAPVAPKPKEEPKEVPDLPPPLPKSDPKPEPKKSDAPKPEVKKPEPKKPDPKPAEKKPVEKPAEIPTKKADAPPAKPKPKEEPKPPVPQEQADFSSVLKNLAGEEAPPVTDSQARDTNRQAPQLTAPAPLGSQLSMSEMDALRYQLAQCWRVLPGARDAATLVVQISITVTPDKHVQDARVVDQLRYNSDAFFRAAADSALGALRSPACTPLNVPDGKYDRWKSMTINFDPKEMF